MTMKKEDFVPIEEGKVKMYACGPTVYNYIHVGNHRLGILFNFGATSLQYKCYPNRIGYKSNNPESAN